MSFSPPSRRRLAGSTTGDPGGLFGGPSEEELNMDDDKLSWREPCRLPPVEFRRGIVNDDKSWWERLPLFDDSGNGDRALRRLWLALFLGAAFARVDDLPEFLCRISVSCTRRLLNDLDSRVKFFSGRASSSSDSRGKTRCVGASRTVSFFSTGADDSTGILA